MAPDHSSFCPHCKQPMKLMHTIHPLEPDWPRPMLSHGDQTGPRYIMSFVQPGLSTRSSVVGRMERLGDQNTGRVQDCLDAAAHCEKRAASARDPAAKNAFVTAAVCWPDFAQCWRELPHRYNGPKLARYAMGDR